MSGKPGFLARKCAENLADAYVWLRIQSANMLAGKYSEAAKNGEEAAKAGLRAMFWGTLHAIVHTKPRPLS